MLFKIIVKNFRFNLKNYVLFFISEMMAIIMLFTFLALKYSLSAGVEDGMTRYIVNIQFMIAAAIIIIISAFVMIFSMKYYMKIRIRDYGMFLTLGMKRSMIFLMLLTESGAGVFMSIAGGLVLGNGVLFGCQKLLRWIDPAYQIHMKVPLSVYGDTILFSLVIMLTALFSIMILIGEKNVSDLAEDKQKKELRPKGKWLLFVLAGIALCVLGIYIYKEDVGEGAYRAIMVWALAVFFLLYFGVGIVLELLKRNQRFYFRNLLHLSQLYHQYSSNYLIMYGLALIHFIAIGYLAGQIAETLPLNPDPSGYPYDIVWSAADKDEDYIRAYEKKYDAAVKQYPMFSVVGRNMVQHTGISESTYQEITGERAGLKGDQILYVDQYMKYLDRKSKEEILDKTDIIHIGRYRKGLVEVSGAGAVYGRGEFQKTNIREMVVRPAVGRYSIDGWHTNVLVFSDSYFEEQWRKIREKTDEQNLLVLINLPKAAQKEGTGELKEYEEKEGIKNDAQDIEIPNLFVTDSFLEGLKMQNTFNFTSRIIILFALVFSCLFLIGLKGFSAMEFYRRQDEFFYCMGMKRSRRRKAVKKEIYNGIRIPVFFGGGMGLVYTGCYAWIFEPAKYGDYTFWKAWIMVSGGYIAVVAAGAFMMSQYLVRKMEEVTRHERY